MRKPRKNVNIRCRSCWIDVGVQKIGELMKPCPLCGKKETYEHSFTLPKKREVKVNNYFTEEEVLEEVPAVASVEELL